MAFYANIVALDSGRELCLFKLFPVTLTLAGIAGFILSIGIAVDANVLIFERMKEEIRTNQGRATKKFLTPKMISLIPESNATILAQNVKNVKLDSYEKLQKIKSL